MLKQLLSFFVDRLPLKPWIVLESVPDCADNTQAVFEELLRRQCPVRLIWWLHDPDSAKCLPQADNVTYVTDRQIFRKFWMIHRAAMLISCNVFLEKPRPDQYALFLSHGTVLKNTSGYYNLPRGIDKAVCICEYLKADDAHNLQCGTDRLMALGFPRNDVLRHPALDPHTVFPGRSFDKVIYWMPTYRQHKVGICCSDIAMPILYTEEIAEQVNRCAAEQNVLVVVKPHPAQDLSRIQFLHLSHLIFIDNSYLSDHGITNYQLLSSTDAMLTDYSSVFYDYLLTDRPIGLCWDDFDSFKEKEGFTVDPQWIASCGETLYTAEDLCGFITRVARGEDRLRAQREKMRAIIHPESDRSATERVTDHIENVLRKLL